jgi:hypothetical protein
MKFPIFILKSKFTEISLESVPETISKTVSEKIVKGNNNILCKRRLFQYVFKGFGE